MPLRKRSNKPVDTVAQTDTREANGTLDKMYPSSVAAHREVQIDPDPVNTRPEHVTKPKASFFDGEAPMYNALGLRSGSLAGVFSTHRPAPDQRATAARRQEQESRAWRGFEAMLNLFNSKR